MRNQDLADSYFREYNDVNVLTPDQHSSQQRLPTIPISSINFDPRSGSKRGGGEVRMYQRMENEYNEKVKREMDSKGNQAYIKQQRMQEYSQPYNPKALLRHLANEGGGSSSIDYVLEQKYGLEDVMPVVKQKGSFSPVRMRQLELLAKKR